MADPAEQVLASQKHGLVVDYGYEELSCECGWQPDRGDPDQATQFDGHFTAAIAAKVLFSFDAWTPLGDPPAVDVWKGARHEVRSLFERLQANG